MSRSRPIRTSLCAECRGRSAHYYSELRAKNISDLRVARADVSRYVRPINMGFTRRVEDFKCENCAASVKGSGYTNHCPQCLWSKHVDIMPGDRAEICQGMMRPTSLQGSTPLYRIVQVCEKCHLTRTINATDNDSPEALLSLASA